MCVCVCVLVSVRSGDGRRVREARQNLELLPFRVSVPLSTKLSKNFTWGFAALPMGREKRPRSIEFFGRVSAGPNGIVLAARSLFPVPRGDCVDRMSRMRVRVPKPVNVDGF